MRQNKIKLFKLLRYICLACVFSFGYITIVATGGGGGGGSTSSSTTGDDTSGGDTAAAFTVSGLVAKGLVSEGTINIYKVTDDGQKGDLLGSATTDSDGAYSVDIGDYDGPVLVEVTGGTYTDEATGETVTLDGTLRAALPSVSDDVDVAVTPLTEIAVRMAEAGGELDSVKIADSNELLSQMIGADITSTMPADSRSSEAFDSASEDAQNYALLLAGISQMSETSGQDVTAVMDAIEEDIGDLMLDQTSSDLSTAIDDFLKSDENETGADADDTVVLVDIINDVKEGFEPTGDLAEVKEYLIAFLKDPTETNYSSLMTYMDTFVADSAEAYLFKAVAELTDIYSNTDAVGFLTDNQEGLGLNLDSLYNETFNGDNFYYNLLNLAALDEDITGLFADLETRLGDVYSDLANAEGAKISISLTGLDTIYLDDIDVKILKTITSALKSVCILVQAIDLGVENWMVDSGTVDIRTLIGFHEYRTDAQMEEFLTNNPELFGWLEDTTKRASFVSALEDLADDLEAVVSALDALGIDGRAARLENAFNIDSDLEFYYAKAASEETMPDILGAMDDSSADIVIPGEDESVGSIVLEDDGYSYFQSEYDIYLYTLSPVQGAITLYDLFNGDKSLRDLMAVEDDPYVEAGEPVLYQGGVEEINWDNPIESFTIPEAAITIDGDASDWDGVTVFQSGQGFTLKLARSDDETTCYAYLSIPTEFNLEEDVIACGIGANWPWWPFEPTESDMYYYEANIGTDGGSIWASVSGGSGPEESEEMFEVEEGDKKFLEADGDIVGIEVKFSNFDLITDPKYLNFFDILRFASGASTPETIIYNYMIKLY